MYRKDDTKASAKDSIGNPEWKTSYAAFNNEPVYSSQLNIEEIICDHAKILTSNL